MRFRSHDPAELRPDRRVVQIEPLRQPGVVLGAFQHVADAAHAEIAELVVLESRQRTVRIPGVFVRIDHEKTAEVAHPQPFHPVLDAAEHVGAGSADPQQQYRAGRLALLQVGLAEKLIQQGVAYADA